MPAIIDRKKYPTFRSKFLIHSTRDRYFSTLVKIKEDVNLVVYLTNENEYA